MRLATATRSKLLEAMGYVPWRLRGASAAVSVRGATAESSDAEADPQSVTAQPVALPVDPLWAALARAAGIAVDDTERAGWRSVRSGPAVAFVDAELHIHLAALRHDVEARRSLWRTLRALRRRAGAAS